MPHPDTLCREEVEIPDDIRAAARKVAGHIYAPENGAHDYVRGLVEVALLSERQAQRERDAKIAKRYGAFEVENDFGAGYKRASLNIADAIRDGGDHA